MMGKSRVLAKEDILAANDLAPVPVDVPEWGGLVYVRQMSAGERDEFEAEWARRRETGETDVRAFIAAHFMCDEQGERLFGPEDIPRLRTKSAAALERVIDAAQRANAMSEKDIEDLAGNSGNGPSGA